MNIIKRLFCTHDYVFVYNLYGDEINHAGSKRNWWRCRKCGKWMWGKRR